MVFHFTILADQETLVPNGHVSDVRMANEDDDVIDITGDPHDVADIESLVDKFGLLDMIQGNFEST